jgi:chorismate mutase
MNNCRGVRGATSVEVNEESAIIAATNELLDKLVEVNNLDIEDIAYVFFTATPDLDTAYPARAARMMGWTETPLLCLQEMAVQQSLPRCIRVLLVWNTDLPADQIQHVYLGRARNLRSAPAVEVKS